MMEAHVDSAPGAPAPEPGGHAGRGRRALIVTLFVLATLFGIVAVHSVWVNRQALNTDNWTSTSSQLLANKEIQTAVAAYAVNQLFSSGEPQAEIKSALPKALAPLAGPLSSGLQQVAGQAAPRILASSQVQAAWRAANRAAHATLLKIVNGGGSLASTHGGVVTLNLHAIVAQLAAALGVQQQVAAAQAKLQSSAGQVQAASSKLGVTLPPSSGQLVIMRSGQLRTVQDIADAIKAAALVLPLLTFGLFILAVWLSRGRRRQALRRTGWCFVVIGLFVLLDRRVAGNDIIDALVNNPVNRPAAHEVWTIATSMLYDIAIAVIASGLLLVIAAWLAGHTRPAKAVRIALAPTLRTQPAIAYIAVYAALLLVIVWGPTPATRQLPYIIAFIVLLALGVTALRRQTAREYPTAAAGDAMPTIRAMYGHASQTTPAHGAPTGHNGGHVAELERLAQLHAHGSLTDAEFESEKSVLLHAS
jgi:hypothetical protein